MYEIDHNYFWAQGKFYACLTIFIYFMFVYYIYVWMLHLCGDQRMTLSSWFFSSTLCWFWGPNSGHQDNLQTLCLLSYLANTSFLFLCIWHIKSEIGNKHPKLLSHVYDKWLQVSPEIKIELISVMYTDVFPTKLKQKTPYFSVTTFGIAFFCLYFL